MRTSISMFHIPFSVSQRLLVCFLQSYLRLLFNKLNLTLMRKSSRRTLEMMILVLLFSSSSWRFLSFQFVSVQVVYREENLVRCQGFLCVTWWQPRVCRFRNRKPVPARDNDSSRERRQAINR